VKAAVPLAIAAGATLALAAFTDDATNAGNRATAADVTITADAAATSALFDLAEWRPGPGAAESRCIAVANGGSVPVPIALRFAAPPTGALGDYVDMTITRGSRPRATDGPGCADFTADAVDAKVYAGELGEFPSAAGAALGDRAAPLPVGEERAYRITWALQDDEGAEAQSLSGVTFRWESSS
jgi:hypothetical protein